MKKSPLLILLLALVAGAAYFHLAGDAPREDNKGAARPPVPVSVARAEVRDVPVVLEAVGRGEAFESVTLLSRVEGQVLAVPFREGRPVARGEVLVRLDPADFDARLRQAQANLARDEALLAKARADVARYGALKESGFVSAEKLGEVRATAEAAAATVRADRAALELARLQLGYTTVRAPFDGVVGAKLVFPGAGVKPNDTPLAVVHRLRPLKVGFALPERHLPALRAALARGLAARVTVPGAAGADEAGTVAFIDPAVDAATGTIRLHATVANAREHLAPGQFLNVRLELDWRRGALVVPEVAVQQGPEGAFVYVLRPDQGVALRPVAVADHQGGLAVIARGLAAGETVVTDGHARLTPRSRVTVKPAVEAAAGAAR